MTRLRVLLPCLLASAVLAGCGADDGAPAPAAAAPAATTPVQTAATGGRTGAATSQSAGDDLVRLSGGRAIAPASARQAPGQRDGVGAGEACADVDLIPVAETVATVAQATLCLLNGERADRGLVTLTENPQLAQAALGHAQDMVAKRYFSHDGADGSTMTDRIALTGYLPESTSWIVGENLAWGTGSLASARAIMNAWMNSEGHRENILDARYREIGLGIALGNPNGSDAGATYATEFGARGDGSAPATADAPASEESSGVAGITKTSTRRALARKRRACRRKPPRRARACKARVARLARAAARD